MKKRAIIVLTIVLVIVSCGIGYYACIYNTKVDITVNHIQDFGELTQEQKLEDFNYLYNIFKDNFPFFEVKKRVYGYDWLETKVEFEKLVRDSKDNVDFYYTIDKILRRLQNAHTHVLPPSSVEEYRKLYSTNSNPWKQVLNNLIVIERNKYWLNKISYQKSAVPLAFEYVEGVYTTTHDINGLSSEHYGIPEGSILQKVNETAIDEYIETLIDSSFLQYDFKLRKLKKNYLIIYTDILNTTKLIFRTPDGDIIEKAIDSIEIKSKSNNSGELPDNIDTFIVEDNEIAYVKIKSLWREYVDIDKTELNNFFKNVKDYKNLIIDIRGNGGGSDNYWENNIVAPLIDKTIGTEFYQAIRTGKYIEPFVKHKWRIPYRALKTTAELPTGKKFPSELKEGFGYYKAVERTVSPINPVGFKGNIYLLVDEGVYSSSESFAAFAKATGWATLVGTVTGGDGIGFDPVLFNLPNSGLIIRFTCDMGLNPDGTVNEEKRTQPDIYVERSYEDYMGLQKAYKSGLNVKDFSKAVQYDTILKKVLSIIKK